MKTYSIIQKIILLVIIADCLSFIIKSPVLAQEKFNSKQSLSKSPINNTIDHTQINVGNISMWVWADGRMAINPDGEAGVVYPRGTTANIISQDGITWGGLVRDGMEPLIRVGGQQYNAGTQPGRIITKGVAENPADPDVNRIWRIRKNLSSYMLEQEIADLQGKSWAEMTAEVNALRNKYLKDWREWPWQKGAPFYDADGDGIYNPEFYSDGEPILCPYADEPGIADADQVVWFVCNDLDPSKTMGLAGSPSIGIEVQITLWAYQRYHTLDNCIFKQVRFIYKGTEHTPDIAKIDSMFIGQWSDPDIGTVNDDLAGCDSLLDLGIAYNSSTIDDEFKKFNLSPAAIGYDLLAGPVIPRVGSTAFLDLKIYHGFQNLPLTTSSFWTPAYDQDPGESPYDRTLEWWNILHGFKARPLVPPTPWIDPITGKSTPFRAAGDPIMGLDWIDSDPGDKLLFLGSGPFTMSYGDTNEINIALVAGLGGDRLLSVSVMKYYDRIAQAAFNNLFEFPQLPPSPTVAVSEMDGQIILNWSNSQEQVETVEQWEDSGHRFEGYNVYQMPSRYSWPKSEWLKLATYDLKNEVGSIIQEEFDEESGAVLTKAVQVGTNSGIVRSLIIKDDKTNNYPLINGKTYYFAVTSYSYNPDRSNPVKSMESYPTIVTATPQSLKPGERLQATVGDTVFTEHTMGISDGNVFAIVADPIQLTGDDYRVEFYQDKSGKLLWRLLNNTTRKTLLKDQANQSGDENYLITEGFLLKVIKASMDFQKEDIFAFSTANYRTSFDSELAKQDAAMINVYPNPYYGIFTEMSSTSEQYVTFSHLPQQAVIRIFTLAGVLVKTIVKDDQSQFVHWYMNNEKGRMVGNGIYIVHIKLPELDVNKILKLVIVHK